MREKTIEHTIPPVYDEKSKILILGSFPSVLSREALFYYGNPRNRFWRVLSIVLKDLEPVTIEDKKDFLLKHQIAVWDVIARCTIKGSDDRTIRDVVPNDLTEILKTTRIKRILANGTKAYDLYNRYLYAKTGIEAVKMPSTSPANAAYSVSRLCEAYEKEIGVREDEEQVVI